MSGKSVFHPNKINGITSGGQQRDVSVSSDGELEVSVRDKTSAFGEQIVLGNEPRAQIDAIFGNRETDVITFAGGNSSAQYATIGITGFSGGIKVFTLPMTTSYSAFEDVSELDIRLEAGETLTITAELVSSTADTGCAISWQKD